MGFGNARHGCKGTQEHEREEDGSRQGRVAQVLHRLPRSATICNDVNYKTLEKMEGGPTNFLTLHAFLLAQLLRAF